MLKKKRRMFIKYFDKFKVINKDNINNNIIIIIL